MINYTLFQSEDMLGDMLFETEEHAECFMKNLVHGFEFIGKINKTIVQRTRKGNVFLTLENKEKTLAYSLIKQ